MTQTALVLTRTFQAPRALVFQAFTDAEQLSKWWGPAGYTATARKVEARPGGAFEVDMHAPDGTTFAGGGEFVEVDAPARFVVLSRALGGALETRNTVEFAEADGATTVTLRVEVVKATPEIGGMEAGWTMSLDKLDALLATPDAAFLVSRVFEAPRALVSAAFTEGEHLATWWGDTAAPAVTLHDFHGMTTMTMVGGPADATEAALVGAFDRLDGYLERLQA